MLSLKLGPLAISVAQALVLFALLIAMVAGKLSARGRDVAITDTLFNIALAGFVVSRVAFVVRYYDSYGLDPLAWIDIRDGGFDMIAALAGTGIYASYILVRNSAIRRPLGIALFAGVLTWGLTGVAVSLIENQANQPPTTQLYTLDGVVTDLASLRQSKGNPPMVVNLWATWCPPCRAEMPVLEQAQNERPDILFVLANQYEAAPVIKDFLQQMQLNFDHVLQDRRGDIAVQAGSVALPTTLFYNAEGHLVDSHLGQLSKATLARALERFDSRSPN